MKNKVAAVLNPRAAGGRSARMWPLIEQALTERLGSVEPFVSERPNHATQLTRQALEQGYNLVVAVGGDGTVNEIVNGFLQNDEPVNPDAQLGFIAIGTGSDLQRTLKVPSRIDDAVDLLAGSTPWKIDIGKASLVGRDGSEVKRYFINLISFGMGGAVSVKARNLFTTLSGKLAFLYGTVVVFLTYRGRRVRLMLDGNALPEELLIANVAVGNGRYHGGGMHPCPRAVMDDGLLEVTTIRHLSMFEFIRDLPILYSDNVYQHPKVDHYRAKEIQAESDEETLIEVDGEALGRLPLRVTILPAKIPILAPSSSTS